MPDYLKVIIAAGIIAIFAAIIMFFNKNIYSYETHEDLINSIKMVIEIYKKKFKRQ